MCKRNSPDKKLNKNEHWMCSRYSPDKKYLKNKQKTASTGSVRETPCIKIRQHGVCKRNSPHKNEAIMGCVREIPQIKMKLARDV